MIPRSDQSVAVAYTAGPSTVADVAYSRSFAEVTAPESPLIVKRTKLCTSG